MNEAGAVMRDHLFPGEKLLWSGRPRQGLVLRPIDMFLLPMTLGWVGFAILWQLKLVDLQKSAPFLSIVGIPFVVVVLYFLVSRFLMDAKRRSNTCYGVTDGRIIISSGIFSLTRQSLHLDTLPEVSITESTSTKSTAGEGTISFGTSPYGAVMAALPGFPGSSQNDLPRFEVIPDGKSVYEMILSAQRKEIRRRSGPGAEIR